MASPLDQSGDLPLLSRGQLFQRESGGPHAPLVEVRFVGEPERRIPRLEFCRALEEADDLPSRAYAGIPCQVLGERDGALDDLLTDLVNI